jgi:hypothetical protein
MVQQDNQKVERSLEQMRSLIDSALAAHDTRDAVRFASEAQAAAAGLKHYLDRGLDSDAYADIDSRAVRRGADDLSVAITTAEKVGLSIDPESAHRRVTDFKADLDSAMLRIRQALGLSLE